MPQPLSRIKHATIHLGNSTDSPSNRNEKIALLAMSIIAQWSILESWLNGIFIKLLGSSVEKGMAIYSALSSNGIKMAAIDSVAVTALPKDQYETFAAILKLVNDTSEERHKIAHWVWGYCPEHPKGVLLANPRALMKEGAELATKPPPQKGEFPFPQYRKDNIFLYKEKDFSESLAKINRLMGFIAEFRIIAFRGPYLFADSATEELEMLNQRPEIAAALVALRAQNTSLKAPRSADERPMKPRVRRKLEAKKKPKGS